MYQQKMLNMSLSSYKFQKFQFSKKDRHGLLVQRSTGMPLYYQNLYLTCFYFTKKKSINTVKSVAKVLGYFADICDYLKIDIESQFRYGSLLNENEIQQMCSWLMKPVGTLYEQNAKKNDEKVIQFKRKRIDFAKYTVLIDENIVMPETAYNRIGVVADYLCWLAEKLKATNMYNIERMRRKFLRQQPVVVERFNKNQTFKSLDENDKAELLRLVELNSTNNPWKNESVKFRNKLIVHILLYVGCRKGELLLLKARDIDPASRVLKIRKEVDSKEDVRSDPALAKTLSRDFEINEELHTMIQDYIIYHRSKVTGANKTPYLFISHQNGAKSAKPLSLSAVDDIFRDIKNALQIDVFPHALRHTWNDVMSEQVEKFLDSGEITENEVEDLRSYLMGWKEGSGTAKTYTKRYQAKKAMKVGLYLQRRTHEQDVQKLKE
jgi:integrase